MPKRKIIDDSRYEVLCKKLKRMEQKIKRNKEEKRRPRRRRVRVLSSSSSSSEEDSSARHSEHNDYATLSPTLDDTDLPRALLSQPSISQAEGYSQDVALTVPNIEAEANSTPQIEEQPDLDVEVLEILGADPTKINVFGKSIQNDVAVRFEHIATTGLTKEARKELTDKYLIPENFKLVGPPALNPEIKAALSEMVVKRDKVIETKQSIMTSAISCLGEAITLLLSSKEKNTDLLRLLMDTGRAISDCQHNDTVTRRNFILFAVKKEMKESLLNAKVDSFLFGQQLPETLKAAKAISKTGADLKPPSPPRPAPSGRNTQSKNWKSFYPARKKTGTKEDSTPSTSTTSSTAPPARNQRHSSYKQSQSQRPAYKRR